MPRRKVNCGTVRLPTENRVKAPGGRTAERHGGAQVKIILLLLPRDFVSMCVLVIDSHSAVYARRRNDC